MHDRRPDLDRAAIEAVGELDAAALDLRRGAVGVELPGRQMKVGLEHRLLLPAAPRCAVSEKSTKVETPSAGAPSASFCIRKGVVSKCESLASIASTLLPSGPVRAVASMPRGFVALVDRA